MDNATMRNKLWSDNALDIATIPTKIEARINEHAETQNWE